MPEGNANHGCASHCKTTNRHGGQIEAIHEAFCCMLCHMEAVAMFVTKEDGKNPYTCVSQSLTILSFFSRQPASSDTKIDK
jgi:hypothetical protein